MNRILCALLGTAWAQTTLSAGSCPAGASWSEWRSEDGPSGHCDYD